MSSSLASASPVSSSDRSHHLTLPGGSRHRATNVSLPLGFASVGITHRQLPLDPLDVERDGERDRCSKGRGGPNVVPRGPAREVAPNDSLAPDERHHVYKMLKLRVAICQDDTLEISGIFGDNFSICHSKTLQASSAGHAAPCPGAKPAIRVAP